MQSNTHCSGDVTTWTQLLEQQFKEERGNWQFEYLKSTVHRGHKEKKPGFESCRGKGNLWEILENNLLQPDEPHLSLCGFTI